MTQPVYVVPYTPNFSVLGFLIMPALVPPGILVWMSWDWLAQQHLHPMFVYIALGLEVAAILYSILLFYRYLPRFITVSLTVLYMAGIYGYGAHLFGADEVWTGGVAVATGIAAYFLGTALSNEQRASRGL